MKTKSYLINVTLIADWSFIENKTVKLTGAQAAELRSLMCKFEEENYITFGETEMEQE